MIEVSPNSYKWVIVSVCALTLTFCMGILVNGLSAYLVPLEEAEAFLKPILSKNPNKVITVKADAVAAANRVIDMMDAIADIGPTLRDCAVHNEELGTLATTAVVALKATAALKGGASPMGSSCSPS